MNKLLLSTVIALGISTTAMSNEMTQKSQLLSGNFASELALEAMTICKAQGYNVSAAVVDRHGNLLALSRNEMASPHTVSSATQKAFTSASMGRDTASLAKLIVDMPALQGLTQMDDRLLLLQGGLPISVKDVRLAGIGVGGAPGGHLDEACAQQAIEKLM